LLALSAMLDFVPALIYMKNKTKKVGSIIANTFLSAGKQSLAV
jgi:hypothetical protein